jgi:hypothetical protein
MADNKYSFPSFDTNLSSKIKNIADLQNLYGAWTDQVKRTAPGYTQYPFIESFGGDPTNPTYEKPNVSEYNKGVAALEEMNKNELSVRKAQLSKPKNKSNNTPNDTLNDFDIVMKTPPTKEEKEAAQKRIDNKNKSEKKETETKTGKDYGELGFFQKLLKAATENPEATLALGRALLKGEGLGIGLSDFAEEKIAQDKAQAALDVAAEEKAYTRAMEKAKFNLDVAKAEALADYYGTTSKAALLKAEKLPGEVEAAQAYALQMSGGDPALFKQYFKEAFDMLAKKSSSGMPMFTLQGEEGDLQTSALDNSIDVATRTQNELMNQ